MAIYDRFFTRRYRVRVTFWRVFRGRDFLTALLLVLVAAISALGAKNNPSVWKIVIVLLAVYGVLTIVQFYLNIRARYARYGVQADVVGGLLSFINKELFHRSNHTRFTVFRRAPFRGNYVVPWYRFLKGGKGPIEEADDSCSRYEYDRNKPDGVTGRSWVLPAKEIALQFLPEFTSRIVMEAYYAEVLGVRPETARSISSYMQEVGAIASYTFLDGTEQFIGILSLDIWRAEVRPGVIKMHDGTDKKVLTITPASQSERGFAVDSDTLFLLVRAVGNVLESFRNFERRVAAYD